MTRTKCASGWGLALGAVVCLMACGTGASSNADPGPILFATYCRRCHGDDGRGGRYAGRTSTAPADLTMLTLSETEVARTITEGVPGTDMPPHALEPADLEALAAYVMSLRAQRVQ